MGYQYLSVQFTVQGSKKRENMVLRKGTEYRAQCLALRTRSVESHKERAT